MILEAIKKSVLFNGLPETLQTSLAGIATSKKYKSGDILFAQGDPASGFHLIALGRVKVYKLSGNGKEQLLHLFTAGDPIGEAAVFMGHSYPAWAQALEESRTIFFPRKSLKTLLGQNPELAFGLLGILSMRLIRFTKRLENSAKEVPARLASFLLSLEQKGQEGVKLGMSKAQLASVLDTTPESISRVFRRLKDLNIITESKTYITIIDRDRLCEFADVTQF